MPSVYEWVLSLFASWLVVSTAMRYGWAWKLHRKYKSIAKNSCNMANGKNARPADRPYKKLAAVIRKGLALPIRWATVGWGAKNVSPMDRGKSVKPDDFYIVFMKPKHGESFAEFASWPMDMANVTGSEIGWFWEDTLATCHPGDSVADIYWRWCFRRTEVHDG